MKTCIAGLLLAVSFSFVWAQDSDYCRKFNRCKSRESKEKVKCSGCNKRDIYKDFARCMNCGVKQRVCTKCGSTLRDCRVVPTCTVWRPTRESRPEP